MSGWYTSAMNYDMLSPNPWNTMNLHMNQLWDNSTALQGMNRVPMYSFDNFMPYGNMAGNSYLTNPFYTLNQMSWGTPAWGNMPWNNGGMNNSWSPWGNMGWNGGNSNGNSGDNNLSAEEKGFKRKYNTLLALVKQLKNYDSLSNAQKDELDVASRITKKSDKTWEDTYNELKEAYNKIDKDTVREFLVEGHALGVSGDIKGNAKNKDSFFNRLLGTGYEYSDAGADKALDKFYEGIKNLKGNDGTDVDAEGVLGLIENGTYDILDFVSSWNNEYKSASGSERVIKHFASYYNKIDDAEAKKTAKSKVLTPLVNSMIKKANSVKGSLDADSKKQMEKAVDALRKALENTKCDKKESKVDSNLSKAFDKVYLYARQASMAELRNDAKGYYGEIDSKVFNDTLFESELVKDLKSEGFSDSAISAADVKISDKKSKKVSSSSSANNDGGDDDTSANDLDNKSATEQINGLKKDKVIEALTVKHGDKTVYQEKTMTGDSNGDGKADYARLFYINDSGKLVEWTNTKLNNNKFEIVKAGVAQEEQEIKSSEIVAYKNDVKDPEDAKKKDDKSSDETVTDSDAEDISSYSSADDDFGYGKTLAEDLIGYTSDYDERNIEKIITQNVNEKNIWFVMRGYRNNHGWGNRFFYQMASETNEFDTTLTKQQLMQIVLGYVIKNLKAQAINLEEYGMRKSAYENSDVLLETDKKNYKNDIQSLEKYAKKSTLSCSDCEGIDNIIHKYIMMV